MALNNQQWLICHKTNLFLFSFSLFHLIPLFLSPSSLSFFHPFSFLLLSLSLFFPLFPSPLSLSFFLFILSPFSFSFFQLLPFFLFFFFFFSPLTNQVILIQVCCSISSFGFTSFLPVAKLYIYIYI